MTGFLIVKPKVLDCPIAVGVNVEACRKEYGDWRKDLRARALAPLAGSISYTDKVN